MDTATSSIRILACRDTLATARIVQRAGWGSADVWMPAVGVTATEWTAWPPIVTVIEPEHVPGLHAAALQQAWACGAWDLEVTIYPAAPMGHDGLPGDIGPALERAACRGRLIGWYWRPMRGGPPIRSQQEHPDVTLRSDLGRDGAPPTQLPGPIWTWRKSRSWTITLGHHAEPVHPRFVVRATPRQRAYIVALRRQTGVDVGMPLPARLSLDEASAMIDRLRVAGRASR